MLRFTYIGNTLHMALYYGGRTVWAPVHNLTPRPTGGVGFTPTGTRPLLRALRRGKPQVQACKLPTAHPASVAARGTAAQW